MSEDRVETQDQTDAQAAGEGYEAPALTDLGSFEDLTQFSPGTSPDAEGAS